MNKLTFRTLETEQKYIDNKAAGTAFKPFLEEPRIQDFVYWAIIENAYPGDRVFKTHHLLFPKRPDVSERMLLQKEERLELDKILEYVDLNYDIYYEATPRVRSVKGLMHYHLAEMLESE